MESTELQGREEEEVVIIVVSVMGDDNDCDVDCDDNIVVDDSPVIFTAGSKIDLRGFREEETVAQWDYQ